MSISIVIPAYNEEENIGDVLKAIPEEKLGEVEIIVVDDCSSDNTTMLAEHAGARVIRHPYNMGNGAAVKTGIRAAHGDIIVMIDGDGQYNPADIPALVENIGEYDMVVGARKEVFVMSFHRGVANKIYNLLATYISGQKIKDLTSGFRAIKAGIAKSMVPLLPNSFSYPSTITLAICKYGYSLKYVEVVHKVREKGKSKIRIFRDGSRFLLIITRIAVFFSPLKLFLPLSLAFFVAGLIYLIVTILATGRFTPFALLMFVTSILVFSLGLISEQIAMLRLNLTSRFKA